MILKTPFQVSPSFLSTFGYDRGRRFVGIFWDASCDASGFHDGTVSACGLSNNYLFLDFVHRPEVCQWITRNRVHLGDSSVAARHWLVIDFCTQDVYAVSRRVAQMILRLQQFPNYSEATP